MSLHDRLKEERERLGYSQTNFAALADASKHAQINWEKGVASPNAAALAEWAAVGLDVLYVVTGQRDFVPPKALSAEEQTMLDYFRDASKEVRRAALGALLGAASSAPAGTVGSTHSSSGAGAIHIGSVGDAPPKRR